MISDLFGLLNELKSKVDILSVGQPDSSRVAKDSSKVAAPGPEKQKEPQIKVDPIISAQTGEDEDSDYKEDFESTFKNSENGQMIESSEQKSSVSKSRPRN